MTEEEKTETAEVEKEADVEAKSDTGTSTEEEIDYKALQEAETARAEAAEKAAADIAFKLRQAKREGDTESMEEDEKLSETKIREIIRSETAQTQKSLQRSTALEIARANTSSESEAQAAMTFWEKRVIPSDNLEEDVKFAIGGVNNKKIVAKSNEMKRALKSKETASSDGVSAQRDGLPKNEPKLSDDSPLKKYKYEGNGVYSKKLATGRTMFVNTKAMPGQPKHWTE